MYEKMAHRTSLDVAVSARPTTHVAGQDTDADLVGRSASMRGEVSVRDEWCQEQLRACQATDRFSMTML